MPNGVAPPVQLNTTFRQHEDEEDNDTADDNTRVEGSSEDVVVTHPPPEVEAAHEPLEEGANHEPRGEVDSGGRWHDTGRGEEKRHVDVAPDTAGIPSSQEVEGNGRDGSDDKEPEDRPVPMRYVRKGE